jgi:hypothetical protein
MKLIILIVALVLLFIYYYNPNCFKPLTETFVDTITYFDNINQFDIEDIDSVEPLYIDGMSLYAAPNDIEDSKVYQDRVWTIKDNLSTDIFNNMNNDSCSTPFMDPNWNTEIFSCASGTTYSTTSKDIRSGGKTASDKAFPTKGGIAIVPVNSFNSGPTLTPTLAPLSITKLLSATPEQIKTISSDQLTTLIQSITPQQLAQIPQSSLMTLIGSLTPTQINGIPPTLLKSFVAAIQTKKSKESFEDVKPTNTPKSKVIVINPTNMNEMSMNMSKIVDSSYNYPTSDKYPTQISINDTTYNLLAYAVNPYYEQYYLLYENIIIDKINNPEVCNDLKYLNFRLFNYVLVKMRKDTPVIKHIIAPRSKINIEDNVYFSLGVFQLGPLHIKQIKNI